LRGPNYISIGGGVEKTEKMKMGGRGLRRGKHEWIGPSHRCLEFRIAKEPDRTKKIAEKVWGAPKERIRGWGIGIRRKRGRQMYELRCLW